MGPFTFVREDLAGTNPKIVIRDASGEKWSVKFGAEAAPETAASRLTWAAGYFANEDYFLRDVRVENIPHDLKRARRFVGSGGTLHNVRLKRHHDDEKKTASWAWYESPFAGTRELNGLRVLMALMNNWDLTDENNAVFEEKRDGSPVRIYMVSDLGSTFGTGSLAWPLRRGRGDLDAYRHSQFATQVAASYVDFHTPTRPEWFFLFTPREYWHKLQLCWIAKRIPRQHVRWMGDQLARLSPQQIRDAFRAAGYSEDEVEGFASEVERRVAQLERL